MSISACSHCWDNPCTCGHDYKSLPEESRLTIAAACLGLTEAEVKQTQLNRLTEDQLSEAAQRLTTAIAEQSSKPPLTPEFIKQALVGSGILCVCNDKFIAGKMECYDFDEEVEAFIALLLN